jgi:hypothetical protein
MQLTNIGGASTGTPRWSPDGQEIAFDSMDGTNRDIYIVSSMEANTAGCSFATGDVRPVASLERPVHPRVWDFAVSPDRRWILYTQLDQSSSDIMLMEKFR